MKHEIKKGRVRPKLLSEHYGLKKREVRQLRAAEDAVRVAQDALEKLSPLREKSNLAKERRWRLRRTELANEQAEKPPLEEQRRRRESDQFSEVPKLDRLVGQVTRSGWRRPKREKHIDLKCPYPKSTFVSMYRRCGAVDRFALQLGVNRRTTIAWLKNSSIDVFEEIAREWEQGQSLRKLSTKHGPQPQTISRWIKSTGREIKPRNSNPRYDTKEILRLREQENMSPYAISEELGVSRATVQKVINDSGVARQRKS